MVYIFHRGKDSQIRQQSYSWLIVCSPKINSLIKTKTKEKRWSKTLADNDVSVQGCLFMILHLETLINYDFLIDAVFSKGSALDDFLFGVFIYIQSLP